MTHAVPYILASDDTALFKLAFWAIVILIFGIVKFIKFVGKLASPTNVSKPSDAPPAMRNTRRAPIPAGAMALPPLPTKAGKGIRKVARRAPAAAVPARPTNPPQGIVGAIQQARMTPTAPPPIAISRSQAAGWLDARTIRAQFILSEAMKPPLSLR
jgi:hypothetical protein